ncbi:MAG: hypothetical protein JST70_12345 [Bacteroidetes bacterium]|nr:hypothetical protein [Bacteroidota bacterium]
MSTEKDFLQWLTQKNKLYHRFNELANIFENFLTDYILVSKENADEISVRLEDMLGKCNIPNIYEKGQAVETYSMLHFLERYRRYQLVYLQLLENQLIPFATLIKHLDIGTGPAPSIFAFSDIIKFYKEFSQKEEPREFFEIEYLPDYVENSDSFRNWLHHFTEYANYKNYSGGWEVPYHHGTFRDFESLDFKKLNYNKALWQKERVYEAFGANPNYIILETSKEITVHGRNFISGQLLDKKKNGHRYDVISFSYFLTLLEQTKQFKKQIKGCAFALRNNGIIINIGSNNDDYFQIAKYIRRTIQRYKSVNKEFNVSCREVLNEIISYNTHDVFSKRIKQSYEFIINNLELLSEKQKIPQKIKKDFDKYINSGQEENIKDFRLQVFQKRITSTNNDQHTG